MELPRHTVRGNPILYSLFFLPLSISLPPFLPFFLASLSTLSVALLFRTEAIIRSSALLRVSVRHHCLSHTHNIFVFLPSLQTVSLACFFPSCVTSELLSAGEIHQPCFYLTYTPVLQSLSLQLALELVAWLSLKWGHAMQYSSKESWEERGLSPAIKPDRRSLSFFHVLNSSLPSTWIN